MFFQSNRVTTPKNSEDDRFGVAAHRQVPLGNQHQVAAERAPILVPKGVHRRREAVIKPEIIEGRRDADELGRRALPDRLHYAGQRVSLPGR